MPTYEYKCTTCEERFEIQQSIKEDTLETLPGDDHEHQLKKLFSPVGIAFRGDGFYRNDARGGSSSSTSSEGSDKPATKINSDGTKPETSKTKSETTSSSD